jgi:4-hydroxy-tetrahydrodipicolinate reductase
MLGVTIQVGVFGAAGRMGRTVCQAVCDDPELELVAAVDPHHEGLDLRAVTGVDSDLVIVGTPDGMPPGVEVVVDFTEAEAARENLRWCGANGIHAVVGTTGLGEDDLAMCRSAFTSSSCLVAPNFAIGAVLMIRLAELAAPWFDSVEIVEMHHDRKIDAPSGTAVHTAERIAAASDQWGDDPTQTEVLPGARGGTNAGGIHVHALRVRGMVASQEVLFGTSGQSLSIRHDTFDRSSFMPGVLLAVKKVATRPGLTVGLDVLLDL